MEVQLKFTLPKDDEAFEAALRSANVIRSLQKFSAWMSQMSKAAEMDKKTLQIIREEFHGIIEDEGICL